MSDVVLLALIQNGFWLILFGAIVWFFRTEIKLLLQSLDNLKIAGATFELKNRKSTIQSCVLLAETLIVYFPNF